MSYGIRSDSGPFGLYDTMPLTKARQRIAEAEHRYIILERIVRDLAKTDPVATQDWGGDITWCTLCQASEARILRPDEAIQHDGTCPWLRAKEWLEQH